MHSWYTPGNFKKNHLMCKPGSALAGPCLWGLVGSIVDGGLRRGWMKMEEGFLAQSLRIGTEVVAYALLVLEGQFFWWMDNVDKNNLYNWVGKAR